MSVFLAAVVMFVASFAATLSILDLHSIRGLEHRVGCIEHPHGESSMAATKVNGRFVVTQPAHRTGCP